MATLTGNNKKVVACAMVGILLASSALVLFRLPAAPAARQTATIDDLLDSKSTRSPSTYEAVFASLDSAYYALIATPIANYYEGGQNAIVPLLVAGDDLEIQDHGVSKAVTRFLDAYAPSTVVSIGKTPDAGVAADTVDGGSVVRTSMAAAAKFWSGSDGALLIKENQAGYDIGMPAVPLASYLDIPVLVVKSTSDAVPTLQKLKVKYTIIAGALEPYGRTLKLGSVEQINDITALGVKAADGNLKSVLADRLNTNCSYVTLANPIDIHHPKVLASNTTTFEGSLTSKDTGSTYFPTAADPSHEMTIPDGWDYVNVIIDSYMPFTQSLPGRDPDKDGQRSYVYFGIDNNGDKAMETMEFFAPSLAYDNHSHRRPFARLPPRTQPRISFHSILR